MKPMNILSLGAGVQSSTLALMAARGEIGPMPAAAIFADTGAEPAAVYAYLDYIEAMLPFPVIRVSAGDLAQMSVQVRTTADGERSYIKHSVPAYVLNSDGTKGMAQRHCTKDFKVDPIAKQVRALGGTPANPAVVWIGISTDEAVRMKPSQKASQVHRWPLIERGMSRADCLAWMKANGIQAPPKSACTFCPYHSDQHWKTLLPEEMAQAIAYEQALQAAYRAVTAFDGVPYLHRSRVPLETVTFGREQADMWGEECEGMCGL